MRRRWPLAVLLVALECGLTLFACSTDDGYSEGGRRLVPPGGAVDGAITLQPVDATTPQDSAPKPDVVTQPETSVDTGADVRSDAGDAEAG